MLALWLRLAARSGARGGELSGLQWPDHRTDSQELVVARSMTRRGTISEGKTGRKGHRVVPLDETTSVMVIEHRRHPGCPWVFTVDGRRPWPPDRPALALRRLCLAENAAIEKAATEAGVKPVLLDVLTPHDFHHFAGTQWLVAGIPVPNRRLPARRPPEDSDVDVRPLDPAQGREAVEGLGRLLDG